MPLTATVVSECALICGLRKSSEEENAAGVKSVIYFCFRFNFKTNPVKH
jgi:hypothetical protein